MLRGAFPRVRGFPWLVWRFSGGHDDREGLDPEGKMTTPVPKHDSRPALINLPRKRGSRRGRISFGFASDTGRAGTRKLEAYRSEPPAKISHSVFADSFPFPAHNQKAEGKNPARRRHDAESNPAIERPWTCAVSGTSPVQSVRNGPGPYPLPTTH